MPAFKDTKSDLEESRWNVSLNIFFIVGMLYYKLRF